MFSFCLDCNIFLMEFAGDFIPDNSKDKKTKQIVENAEVLKDIINQAYQDGKMQKLGKSKNFYFRVINMALLPKDERLLIERKIEDIFILADQRPYLGISSIADPCSRKLWYSFRLCYRERIRAVKQRLFQRGHREEPIIQADLRKAGVKCLVDADNQPEVIFGYGHIKGHIDDILQNVPDAPKTDHLGEYKTSNTKGFMEMKKKGLQLSKPMHYGQMVCYMKGLRLKRGLYVMVCKETDERHYERIGENLLYANELIKKGIDIISTETPPQKIGGPEWYSCKWCPAYEICQFGEKPLISCRTCKNVAILNKGEWYCDLKKKPLSFDDQKKYCDHYSLFDSLK